MARIAFTAATVAAVAALVTAQSGPWGQCGGIGWTGATTCTNGWTCTYSNPYYSQCLQGTSSAAGTPTTTTTKSTTTAVPTTTKSSTTTTKASSTTTTKLSSTTTTKSTTTTSSPAATTTSSGGSAPPPLTTLAPNQLWFRADETPYFHKYVQSINSDAPGIALLGPVSSAAQFNVVNGQFVMYIPDGTMLYGHVQQMTDPSLVKLQLSFATTPDTYGTFSLQGDALNWSTPSITRPNTGAWLGCPDAAGNIDLYLNLGNYAYMTPAGCSDETINFYNGATAVS